jgi:hypothetical protein
MGVSGDDARLVADVVAANVLIAAGRWAIHGIRLVVVKGWVEPMAVRIWQYMAGRVKQ